MSPQPSKVFISYSNDSPEHCRHVLALANRLRHDGFDAVIDQYEVSPPEGWPRWMERQLESADYIVVVCTPTYLRRVRGEEQPGRGLGVQWESLLTYQLLYDKSSLNRTIVPVTFDRTEESSIPLPLRAASRFCLDSDAGYEQLRDRLRERPSTLKPVIGQPSFSVASQLRSNFVDEGIARNRAFVGRDEEFRRLHDALARTNVAISGGGGVGKTQLAIEYAVRHADEYDGTWWLSASSEALAATTTRLSSYLGVDEDGGLPAQIRAIRLALSKGRHLLILDDLERLETLKDFLLGEPSRVLVTTRLTRLPLAQIEPFTLDVLARTNSVALLRARRPDLVQRDDEALSRVAEQLGDHALALALASEYLYEYPDITPEELLEKLQATELGDRESPLEDPEPDVIGTGYRLRVAESLQLHIARFSGTDAMALLAVASFCAPDDIPLELLLELPRPKQELRRWLRKLDDLSILRYKPNSISIHRLTQSVIRGRLERQSALSSLTRVLDLLAGRFVNSRDHRTWPELELYAPHAMTAVQHAEKLNVVHRLGDLSQSLSLYLRERARYSEALKILRSSERIATLLYGDKDPRVGHIKTGIGSVLFLQGMAEESLVPLLEAERIIGTALGEDNPNFVAVINNIGDSLHRLGRLSEAMSYYRKAERIVRAAGPSANGLLATILNNIASVLQEQDEHEESLRYYYEAKQIYSTLPDADHPGRATFLSNLADALELQGDVDEALGYRQEAERITRGAFSGLSPHPNLWGQLMALGFSLRGKGDLNGALSKFQQAKDVARRLYGDADERVFACRAVAGQILEEQGRVDEALDTYRSIENAPGFQLIGAPERASVYRAIGKILQSKGKPEDALAAYESAECHIRPEIGSLPAELAQLRYEMSQLHTQMGHGDKALECALEAEQLARRVHDNHEPLMVDYVLQTAVALHLNGKFHEALEQYLRALEIAQRVFHEGSERILDVILNNTFTLIFEPSNLENPEIITASRQILERMLLDCCSRPHGTGSKSTLLLAEALARTGGDPIAIVENALGVVAAGTIKHEWETWREKNKLSL